jgi:hypothetical protein
LLDGEQKGMSDLLDSLQSLEFLLGTTVLHFQVMQVPVNELDRFEDASRSQTLPDFAKSSMTDRLKESIPRQWFSVGFT